MKCRYCKKRFKQSEKYCPNCGRELNLENHKKVWPYLLVFSIFFIECMLVFLPCKQLINYINNYEVKDLRENKFIEKVKKLGCSVIDVTENNPYDNILDYYVTDTNTCPYLMSYTRFSSDNLQNNFYNKLVNEINNVNGYRSYSNINFYNYKEYNLTTQNEYKSAFYSGRNVFYIQGDIKDKETLINFKKELGFEFKMDWSFLMCFIILIIIINIVTIVSWWLINVKMGRQGWICLIPVYNIICLCEDVLGKKSYAWFFLIPYANIVFIIILLVNIAKVFGKSDLYQILSLFFSSITIPLIAFDDSKYTRPNKDTSLLNNSNNTPTKNDTTSYIITNDNHVETNSQVSIEETKVPPQNNIFGMIIKWFLTCVALFMALGSYLLVVEDKEYENIIPGISFFLLAIMACPIVTKHTKKFKLYTKYKSLIVFILIVLIVFLYATI